MSRCLIRGGTIVMMVDRLPATIEEPRPAAAGLAERNDEPMLQRETMFDDIRKGLAVYQNYVRPGGTLNLTDTNVHAEDFVAGLLNAIQGWSLVSTNQVTANYPCLDLIDERLGLGVQVTAEEGS